MLRSDFEHILFGLFPLYEAGHVLDKEVWTGDLKSEAGNLEI